MNEDIKSDVIIETYEYKNHTINAEITRFTNLRHCGVCGKVRLCDKKNICKKCYIK